MSLVRAETPADRQDTDEVNRRAFAGEAEVDIIHRLREAGLVRVALVAEHEGRVVGHIVLSELATQIDGREVRALALAPLAVAPGHQRSGIGGALVRASLTAARQTGAQAVIVLGHPDYYPRFGFSAALAARLAAPFHGPAFMALELEPGALAGQAGAVTYPPAFG